MVDAVITLIERYSTVLTLMLGAIAVTGVLWRVVLRPMLIALGELAEQMQALRTVAEAQLTPNGGGSLVDKVNRIAPNHDTAEAHWKALETEQAAIRVEVTARLDEVAKTLRGIEQKPASTPAVVIHNEQPHGGAE